MISKPPDPRNQQFVFQLFLSRNGFDFDAFVCDNCSLGLCESLGSVDMFE